MNYFCITRPKNGRPLFKKDGAIFYACHDQASIVSPEDKFELIIDKTVFKPSFLFQKLLLKKSYLI